MSYRDGYDAEIYVMNADGSGQVRLTHNTGFDEHPAWSPDGSKIAFQSRRNGSYEIYLMDATYGDSLPIVRLTTNRTPGAQFDGYPSWARGPVTRF